jgi:hypothetical protein
LTDSDRKSLKQIIAIKKIGQPGDTTSDGQETGVFELNSTNGSKFLGVHNVRYDVSSCENHCILDTRYVDYSLKHLLKQIYDNNRTQNAAPPSSFNNFSLFSYFSVFLSLGLFTVQDWKDFTIFTLLDKTRNYASMLQMAQSTRYKPITFFLVYKYVNNPIEIVCEFHIFEMILRTCCDKYNIGE